MIRPKVEVEGARDLQRALRKVEGGIDDLKAVHKDAAEIVELRAVQIVPKLHGDLGQSIRSAGQARAGVVRAGFASVPYAGVQHFGWPAHNIAPKPFLYDALDDRRTEVIETYEARVNELVKRNGLD